MLFRQNGGLVVGVFAVAVGCGIGFADDVAFVSVVIAAVVSAALVVEIIIIVAVTVAESVTHKLVVNDLCNYAKAGNDANNEKDLKQNFNAFVFLFLHNHVQHLSILRIYFHYYNRQISHAYNNMIIIPRIGEQYY